MKCDSLLFQILRIFSHSRKKFWVFFDICWIAWLRSLSGFCFYYKFRKRNYPIPCFLVFSDQFWEIWDIVEACSFFCAKTFFTCVNHSLKVLSLRKKPGKDVKNIAWHWAIKFYSHTIWENALLLTLFCYQSNSFNSDQVMIYDCGTKTVIIGWLILKNYK